MEIESKNCILVWPFEDAPARFQELSTNGGDEDWVALVPTGMPVPNWIESGSFGACDTDAYETPEGTVYIGSHA